MATIPDWLTRGVLAGGELWKMAGQVGNHRAPEGPATARDVAKLVRARALLDVAISDAARSAHQEGGVSWAELARELGVTRQAARQRFS